MTNKTQTNENESLGRRFNLQHNPRFIPQSNPEILQYLAKSDMERIKGLQEALKDNSRKYVRNEIFMRNVAHFLTKATGMEEAVSACSPFIVRCGIESVVDAYRESQTIPERICSITHNGTHAVGHFYGCGMSENDLNKYSEVLTDLAEVCGSIYESCEDWHKAADMYEIIGINVSANEYFQRRLANEPRIKSSTDMVKPVDFSKPIELAGRFVRKHGNNPVTSLDIAREQSHINALIQKELSRLQLKGGNQIIWKL